MSHDPVKRSYRSYGSGRRHRCAPVRCRAGRSVRRGSLGKVRGRSVGDDVGSADFLAKNAAPAGGSEAMIKLAIVVVARIAIFTQMLILVSFPPAVEEPIEPRTKPRPYWAGLLALRGKALYSETGVGNSSSFCSSRGRSRECVSKKRGHVRFGSRLRNVDRWPEGWYESD